MLSSVPCMNLLALGRRINRKRYGTTSGAGQSLVTDRTALETSGRVEIVNYIKLPTNSQSCQLSLSYLFVIGELLSLITYSI